MKVQTPLPLFSPLAPQVCVAGDARRHLRVTAELDMEVRGPTLLTVARPDLVWQGLGDILAARHALATTGPIRATGRWLCPISVRDVRVAPALMNGALRAYTLKSVYPQ